MGQERDGNNLAYDRVHWLMYLTEHQRAFPRQHRLPRYVANQTITIPPLVATQLQALDEALLTEALGEHLDERQILAILARRDLALSSWSGDQPQNGP